MAETETSGTILTRTVELMRGNARPAAIVIVGLSAIDALLDSNPRLSVSIGGIVSLVAQYALVVAALRKLGLVGEGERGARLPAMFGLLFITGAAMLLGMVLLIVPGVILAVRWSIVVPILLAEHATIGDSIRQSWRRTAGRFWPIFGVMMIYLVVVIAASAVATLMFAGNPAGTFVTNLLVNGAVVAMWYAAIAIYEQGRPGTSELEEVFA
jgi:hypothetical protein